MIKRYQPGSVPESRAPFSQVVIDDHYAFLSGLVAADFPEGQAVLGDVGAETRTIMEAIQSILGEMGLGMDRIVRAEVHLCNLDDFDVMDNVYRTFFQVREYPARTTTQSDRLFGGSRVEITCQVRLNRS